MESNNQRDARKSVYLVAGGRGRNIFSAFNVFKEITRETGKKRPTIAYVGAASFNDNLLFYLMIAGLLKLACKCRIRRVLTARPDVDMVKARAEMEAADIIFFSGGDMEAGMKILAEKDLMVFFRELYRKGKIFTGGSAGSIMLAEEWIGWSDPEDDTTARLFACLGIAPVICDCHAEGDDWVELKAALKLKGEGATGYAIPSGACLKVYPDGRLEALDSAVARYTLHNGEIERRADLLPVSAKTENFTGRDA